MKIANLNKTVSKLNKEERVYIASYIGGIAATDEEKCESFYKIKNAIKNNRNGILTHIDMEDFSIAYPDSMMFFKDYFDSYKELCNEEELKNLKYERRYGLLFFAPLIFRNNDLDSLRDYALTFDVAGNELAIIKKQYDNLKFEYTKYDSSDVRSMSNLVKRIEDAVLVDEKTKYDVCDEYGIDNSRLKQCLILSEHTSELNEILLENSFGYYDKLSDLYEIIASCVKNGIQYNGEEIKFSLLDYYYLTMQEPQKFIDLFKNSDIANSDRSVIVTLSNFVRLNKNLGLIVNSEMIANDFKLRFVIDGNETVIDQEVSDQIMDVFGKYNIPKREMMVHIAARRYAAGLPILPLDELRKENSNAFVYKKEV